MAMEHNTHLNILNQLIPKTLWGTPKHRALLTEMGIDSVMINKRNLIHIPFRLHHFKGIADKIALLDTRATESFINVKTINRLKLGTQKLETARPVYNVDGTPN
jgi:hypothetical protein